MSDMEIQCPHCGSAFELTDAVIAVVVDAEREKLEAELDRRLAKERVRITEQAALDAKAKLGDELVAAQAAIKERDRKLRAAQAAEIEARKARDEAEEAKREIEISVRRQVDAAKKDLADKARREASAEWEAQNRLLQEQLEANTRKLQQAQEAELAAIKAKTEAEQAKREAGLEVERRVAEQQTAIREAVTREQEDAYRLQLAERDKKMADLRTQLEEARKSAERGSQQLQGDVLELDLFDLLSAAFPQDNFERVKKGHCGGDVIQLVRNDVGVACGKIVWESKRTKHWSESWLGKLRGDQREAKADIAVLASEVLPEDIEFFDLRQGVWVTGLRFVTHVALILRRAVIETATARRAAQGADTKKDLVYRYLTGMEFKARVRGAIEPVIEMRESLEQEKRSMTRQWAKREKQIERFQLSMAGMYGDLQGLVGPSFPQLEGLSLPELPADSMVG